MLMEHHREHLHASGLTDQTIDEAGIYSEIDVASLINCNEDLAKQIQPCIVFPYYGLDGKNGYSRLRPDNPRLIDGKPVKYESPKGEPNRAFFPPVVRSLITSSKYQLLLITEGEKKALTATQEGFPCIGLVGVWGWKKAKKQELIKDLESVVWFELPVYICFDSDIATNRQVQQAETALARSLKERGADVRLVRLPYVPGKKHGLDDYLVEFGAEAFQELLDSAQGFKDAPPDLETEYSTSLLTDAGKSDNANADRFIDAYGDRLRYVPEWRTWLAWDGRRWKDKQDHVSLKFGRDYASSLWSQLGPIAEKLTSRDRDKLNSIIAHIRKTNQAPAISNFVTLAAVDDRICTPKELLDQHPTKLNVRNGTIDLDAMRVGPSDWFYPHRQEDLLTQMANVEFDEHADCPEWRQAMEVIFDSDQDLIRYVRQLLGYCCTGLQSEHLLPIPWGAGGNGKSLVWNTVSKLLGDYSYVANQDLLLSAGKDGHATEKAALYGKRFVAISEPSENRGLNEAKVKELTGGDEINARRMREDFWTFAPTHKFWMSTNHRPRIRGTDEGIWRRVKLIPFTVNIREKVKPRADFDKWLMANEGPGILNWMLCGYHDYRTNGFVEPAAVVNATNQYRSSEDDLGQFIGEYCRLSAHATAQAQELFEAYQQAGGTMSKKAFGMRMKERFDHGKCSTGPNRNKMIYRGICLLAPTCADVPH